MGIRFAGAAGRRLRVISAAEAAAPEAPSGIDLGPRTPGPERALGPRPLAIDNHPVLDAAVRLLAGFTEDMVDPISCLN